MKKTKGKHFKNERKIKLRPTDRFYALMITIFGIIITPLVSYINDGDITGPIVAIFLGLMGYIGTFGEDD